MIGRAGAAITKRVSPTTPAILKGRRPNASKCLPIGSSLGKYWCANDSLMTTSFALSKRCEITGIRPANDRVLDQPLRERRMLRNQETAVPAVALSWNQPDKS